MGPGQDSSLTLAHSVCLWSHCSQLRAFSCTFHPYPALPSSHTIFTLASLESGIQASTSLALSVPTSQVHTYLSDTTWSEAAKGRFCTPFSNNLKHCWVYFTWIARWLRAQFHGHVNKPFLRGFPTELSLLFCLTSDLSGSTRLVVSIF